MRLMVPSETGEHEVIAEEFEIAGSDERFAVHQAIGLDAEINGYWSATHVGTGMRVASGDTINEAIEAARTKWLSATARQLNAALRRAAGILAARTDSGRVGAAS